MLASSRANFREAHVLANMAATFSLRFDIASVCCLKYQTCAGHQQNVARSREKKAVMNPRTPMVAINEVRDSP